ncbi:MAG: hypothetical protein AAGF53_16705 [Pseudomonadota bacterium]
MREPYVVFHGGFHKTATSHIQSMLARNTGHLKKRGVLYVHHRHTRKELTVPCQLYVYEQKGMDYRTKYTAKELANKTSAFFNEMIDENDDCDRIIFSEENLAGHCGHCVKRGLLYLWRKEFIETISSQFPWQVQEVHLGVRNYADFFASAYVEYLRSLKKTDFVDEMEMRKRVMAHMPSWAKVLQIVQDYFPNARLTVWKFEDFRILDRQVIKNLCGPKIDVSKLALPKDKNKRPSASGKAVEALLELIHRNGVETALKNRVALQEQYPRNEKYGGYDPWTAAERAHLSRVYERDLIEIRSNPDINLMEVENA